MFFGQMTFETLSVASSGFLAVSQQPMRFTMVFHDFFDGFAEGFSGSRAAFCFLSGTLAMWPSGERCCKNILRFLFEVHQTPFYNRTSNDLTGQKPQTGCISGTHTQTN